MSTGRATTLGEGAAQGQSTHAKLRIFSSETAGPLTYFVSRHGGSEEVSPTTRNADGTLQNPLILRLAHPVDLSSDDRAVLMAITADMREVPRRTDIIHEGDRPDCVRVVMEGIACRYKLLRDGSRQITAFLVPGDLCNPHITRLQEMDHGIASVSPCMIAEIPPSTIRKLAARHPRVMDGLVWASLADESVMREWIVGLGRRMADRNMAHLICELYARLEAVELVEDQSFHMPITQNELSDALGITTVHTNRTMADLRDRGLIAFEGRWLKVLDLAGLRDLGQFNPQYLHLQRQRPSSDLDTAEG